MGLAHAQRQQLLARNLPDSNKVRTTLGDYLSRTSLHPQDFARGIGYSYTTVRTFIANTYHGVASDDSALRAAILDFIERNPIARSTPVQGKLHETENVRLIRRYFYEALESRSAYYFRGAPGCQKSFVLEHLVAELNESEISTSGHGRRAYYIYCREGIKPTDLLKRVAEAAGAISAGKIDRILRNLRSDFGARKVLLAFDEAQHLDVPCLETVRELLDRPPYCGLLFAGSHELEKTFLRLDMEQWASRLQKGTELPGISREEAATICGDELPWLPQPKINSLIDDCYVRDLRKGREVKYISARLLFLSIAKIKDRHQTKQLQAVSA